MKMQSCITDTKVRCSDIESQSLFNRVKHYNNISTWFIFVLENVIILYHPIIHFKRDTLFNNL